MNANDKLKKWINHNYLTKGDGRMITDKTKWDDMNYYTEHFDDIVYDKLAIRQALNYGDLSKLVNTKELIVDEVVNTYKIHSDIKIVVRLRDKYYVVRYWHYNDGFKWYPKQPYEVHKHITKVTEWVRVKQDS